MKIIFGLGNPGITYKNTRHNIGFMVIDELAKELGTSLKKNKSLEGFIALANIDKKQIVLCKPDTFMNNSGICVKKTLNYFKSNLSTDILIVYDDVDLAFSKIRFKTKGSSGGHRGMESIINHLQTQNLQRVKIGIDRPLINNANNDLASYVLSAFNLKEKELLKETLANAVSGIKDWINLGIIKIHNGT